MVVMIRPDDIHLVPTEGARSRVLSRQFHGSENLYTVSLPSGQIVHSSQGSTSVYQVGTAVELRVLATHTVLFPQEKATNMSWSQPDRPHESIDRLFHDLALIDTHNGSQPTGL